MREGAGRGLHHLAGERVECSDHCGRAPQSYLRPAKVSAPVSVGFLTPLMRRVAPPLPSNDTKEPMANGSQVPQLNDASIGHGSKLHESGELLRTLAGLDIVHVPQKGATGAVLDLSTVRVSMTAEAGIPG